LNLITETSAWFIPLCLAAGAVYALALYYRERRSEFSRLLRWIMGVMRFFTVSIIAFLLLSPLVKTMVRNVEKPVIIIAQDNSQSLIMHSDSAYYREQYPDAVNELHDQLSRDFDVRAYSFADAVEEGLKTDFAGKQTDISAMISEVLIRYANRNVGALIIASDGIFNKGSGPLYAARNVPFPLYTIALGDTNIQKDVILSRVSFNKVAYLGNSFPVEAFVQADKCSGERTTLTVTHNGQQLFTKTLDINDERFTETIAFTIEATQSGVQHYRLALSQVEGEISRVNNAQDIFVNVLDARQKILLIAGAPHPDVAAIRAALEGNENYEVEVALKNEFRGNFDGYNLVILHQVPMRNDNLQGAFATLSDPQLPMLHIIGARSDLNRFNQMKTGLIINQNIAKHDEVQPAVNNEFALFTLPEELRKLIADIPPLFCPYGEYRTVNSATPLFYQKIGSVVTNRPLLLFNQLPDVKIGMVCGEGMWKWRLHNYKQTGNHKVFDELISKIVQYLSVKADKSFFRVKCKNTFLENEQVQFDAEVYNDSYELINDPEVRITITDEQNNTYQFTFGKTLNAYHLNTGMFAVGDYRYTAQVKVGNKVMQETGSFTVSAVKTESINLVADHNLMNALAVRNKGVMVYPAEMLRLVDLMKDRDDITSVAYTQKKYSDIINFFWVFVLIIGLLAAEWLMRKRSGAY
jgi:hypothetical protein